MKNPFLLILKIAITVALISVLIFFIQKDFLQLKRFLAENPVSKSLKIEQGKVKKKAMMITINHFRPDLGLWKEFLDKGTVPDKVFLRDSLRYYQAISDYAPQMSEAYHLSGVCHYLLGEKEAAIANQQKAVSLEPYFFWAWYDLGLMYYREDQFAQSAKAFRGALNAPPVVTSKSLRSSRIFVEIIRSVNDPEILNPQRTLAGYRDAARMLEASVKRLAGQASGIDEEQIPLKIF